MTQEYDASQIKVLEGLEPVRQRPGMYIGSTDTKGLHHMVQEIVDNAVDEALGGYCFNITVVLHNTGYVTVYDDGRGIPVDKHEKTGKSALETILTVLHAGGKFEKSAYKVSGGLHGVGSSVVNALSEEMIAQVQKNGKIYQQTYKMGVPQTDIEAIGESDKTGTIISFKPDSKIFETVEFSFHTVMSRLKQSAYLTPGVCFTIVDERVDQRQRFYFEGGIKTWLKNIVGEQKTLSTQYCLQQEGEDVFADISFQYVDSTNDNIMSFVNNVHTVDGGAHVNGFKNALLKIINETAQSKSLIDKKIGEYQMSDITDGLYAIISIKIPEPQFEGQTKSKLGNSYVRKEVEKITYEYLKEYFKENEEEFKRIVEKIQLSAKARIAAKMAKETVLRKNAISGGVLPGKLADCSIKKAEGTELYIVEGNSAGGSAKQGRDSSFQAILPLKGKILNTESAAMQRILQNNEIKSMIIALGAGIKENFDASNLRYEKIIIMTDADVDGAHIRTLLLTFFYRYMKPLVENGHLYIAVPPLFKLKQGKREDYIYPPNDDLTQAISDFNYNPDSVQISRYKGLGEMNPEQLWETTMDPANRKTMQVSVEDAQEADRLFRVLMGEDVSMRKNFILTHAKDVKELDV
ncbi:DNA gyrase/topoisomerase IV subunit B [Candidatus Absconditicoccus praedator]|uniref:DNA gyrase/topoisomerase IV subunit B n=1 Tax=Candidatus Absconditicoccus praedator TaxID=2735562 RepID=UPI001E29BC0B|nr:DNA topoisomerase subunit B [Candidatus Absconditicoccus praedator]UFX83141.1 type IIA DNA topoisomerase subunit B [Candidatus Absconditicoccus praedator]